MEALSVWIVSHSSVIQLLTLSLKSLGGEGGGESFFNESYTKYVSLFLQKYKATTFINVDNIKKWFLSTKSSCDSED